MTSNEGVTTIGALATAPSPAGIAVIRVSGPKTRTALKALFRARKDPLEEPRHLIFGDMIDHTTGEVIDNALAVFMPGPHSYTGEDIIEFQFHGSPILVQKILRSLFSFGVSPAEPGEFTRRAFLNGKIDLIQAEAISEVVQATSEQALKIAGEHLKGNFSEAVQEIGEPLRDALAELEASVDFPEEGIEPAEFKKIMGQVDLTKAAIGKLLSSHTYGSMVREGFRVLLCGRPNVGKSSLLNLLLDRERAIVTEISGTTRDLIDEAATIEGYKFVFCDSAGIRETNDTVEKIGVELAKDRIGWADLVLFVVDASDSSKEWENVLDILRGKAKKIWMITNKIDLNPQAFSTFFCDSKTCAQNFYLSVKTRSGLEELNRALVEEVANSLPDRAETSNIVTSERQRNCLSKADEALQRALDASKQNLPPEIISSELRIALNALEELVGKTYTEDILGRIFSKFCIGK